MKGTVKFYKSDKGFGFIKIMQGKDVFFHKTGLTKGYEPKSNDSVEFTLIHEDRGDAAADVRKI